MLTKTNFKGLTVEEQAKVQEYQKDTKFEVKKRIILSGNSEVFKNWHGFTGISQEDFIDGVKWVCEDPMAYFHSEDMIDGEPYVRICLTREIAVDNNGEIVKLRRALSKTGNLLGFYDSKGNLWTGHVTLSGHDNI